MKESCGNQFCNKVSPMAQPSSLCAIWDEISFHEVCALCAVIVTGVTTFQPTRFKKSLHNCLISSQSFYPFPSSVRCENRVCLQCMWTCHSLGSHLLLRSVSPICQSMATPILTITTYSITNVMITCLMTNEWPSTIGNVV